MDNDNHKNTWINFTKFVLWGTVAVIIILVLMAIFLLRVEIDYQLYPHKKMLWLLLLLKKTLTGTSESMT